MYRTLRRSAGAFTAVAVTGGLALASLLAPVAASATASAAPAAAPASVSATAPSPDPVRLGLFGQQDATYDGVYRQSLALLALDAADARLPKAAVAWLLRQQCPNGRFTSFRADLDAKCGGYDSNATALAVMALDAAGERKAARESLSWLTGRQLPGGGWEYSPGWGSDASSTGYTIQAMIAMGVNPGRVKTDASGPQYLRSSQLRCDHDVARERGALTYAGNADPFSTVQAAPALAHSTLPVEPGKVRSTLPRLTCPTTGDQPTAAAAAAGYLGRVLRANGGTVPRFGGGPDYGSTANAVLSLVSAGYGATQVDAAMTALEAGAATYTRDLDHAVVPAATALIVLAEHATGGTPRDVDGRNLVRSLLRSRTTAR